MKKKQKMSGFAVAAIMIAVMFVIALVSCDSGDDNTEKTSAKQPTITVQPESNAYFPGVTAEPLTVTASVSDGGTLSYQWYSNANSFDGTAIEGATAASYTPPTSTAGTVYYYVKVTNTLKDKTSSAFSNHVYIVTGFKEAKNFYHSIQSVAFNGDRFVIGLNDSNIAWSSDGINWSDEVNISSVIGYYAYVNVSYVKDRFIAESNTVIATSTTGENWTKVTNPFEGKYPGYIVYGNNHFYSFGDGIKYTDNFTTWTTVTPTSPTTESAFGVSVAKLGPAAYGNAKFMVIGYSGSLGGDSTDTKMASFNGTSWDANADTINVTSGWLKPTNIIYVNNNFIASSYTKIAKSANGTNWTEITPPASIMGTSGISGLGYGSDKLFVFLSEKWAYSDDTGATWTEVIDSEDYYYQVVYGKGVFVAVGSNSVYYSNCP